MLAHLERLIEARTVEDIWALHCDRMADYGFDRLLYGFTRFRTAHSFGNIEDTLILSNHHPDYLRAFLDGGIFNHAPMVRWAADNQGACSWRWVEQQAHAGKLTQAERKVQELNLRYGIRAGYSISFPEQSGRAKGAIGLCAREGLFQHDVEEIWQSHGREIFVLNTLTHLRISSMPFATARRALTSRQREVLEWVGDGKTTADIAIIMGLTVATVEKHLRLAREALDVDTTAQAVLKASFQNQIFLSSSQEVPVGIRR
ncbi:MAG: autoinducer binding domain-containing protein [Rhodobacteraceae bacterium]|jgi:LuxR family transcriptional regulator|nr:autoinducer binding domain-containing protein [Paracoccaceae bacterium]